MKKTQILFLALLTSSFLNAQDNCRDILHEGIFESLDFSQDKSFENQFDSWIASDNFNSYATNSGNDFSLSIPIPDFPIGLNSGSSNESINEFKSSYANKLNTENKRNIREYLVKKTASNEIIAAWSNCIISTKGSSNGLVSDIKNDFESQYVIVSLKWIASAGVEHAIVNSPITIIGASQASNCISEETIIGSEWVSCIFIKENLTSDIIIQIPFGGGLGTQTIKIDGKQANDLTTLEKCFDGDLNACQTEINQREHALETSNNELLKKLEECKKLPESDQFRCTNAAHSIVDRKTQDFWFFKDLVKLILDAQCNSTSNECLEFKAQMNDQIYRFNNGTPLSTDGPLFEFSTD
jgi:hypothetical protein